MNLNELYSETSRHADTQGTSLNVADVSRVCASLFSVMAKLPTVELLSLVAHGINTANGKAGE